MRDRPRPKRFTADDIRKHLTPPQNQYLSQEILNILFQAVEDLDEREKASAHRTKGSLGSLKETLLEEISGSVDDLMAGIYGHVRAQALADLSQKPDRSVTSLVSELYQQDMPVLKRQLNRIEASLYRVVGPEEKNGKRSDLWKVTILEDITKVADTVYVLAPTEDDAAKVIADRFGYGCLPYCTFVPYHELPAGESVVNP